MKMYLVNLQRSASPEGKDKDLKVSNSDSFVAAVDVVFDREEAALFLESHDQGGVSLSVEEFRKLVGGGDDE